MAKRVVEKFVAEMSADDAKFKRTLARSSKEAADWGRNVRRGLSTGIIVGGGALVGLTALVKKTSETIDQQAKFSQRIGISTEALGGLEHAADLTGVSQQNLQLGLQRMTRRLAEAAQGTGEAKGAIKELGLEAEDLVKLSVDEQFISIAEAMSEVDNQSDRVRLAMKLFDSEGVALVNTLKLGEDGLRDARQEAVNFGIALSDVDAMKIEIANDALTRTGAIGRGAANSLTIELAPIIAAIAEDFVEASKEAGGMGNAIADAIDVALTPVGWLADGVHAIGLAWDGVEAAALSSVAAIAQATTGVSRLKVGIADGLGFEEAYADSRDYIGVIDAFSDAGALARQEFADNLLKPLPSEKIKKFVLDARKDAQEAAEEAVDTGTNKTAGVAGPAPAELAAQAKADKVAEAAHKARLARGASITQSVLKPNELYKMQLTEIDALLQRNIISEETHTRKQLEYKAALDESLGVTSLHQEALRILADQIDPLDAQLQALADDQSLLNKAWLEGQISADQFALGVASIDQKMIDLQDDVEEVTSNMSVFADQAARNMQDSFADFLFDPFEDGLGGLADNFAKTLQRMAADAAAAKLFEQLGVENFLSGGSSGEAGGIAAALDFFGGFFADGGRPDPYKASIVGEAGPEMFIPDGISGQVVPYHELISGGGSGGEVTVNQSIQVSGTPDNRSAMQMAQETGATLRRAQRLSG